MNETQRLRQEVKARQRAAGKKIYRVKRNAGAIIAGSEVDPRKSIQQINSMRSRDLRAHLRKLNSFIARPTQFVADAERRPVPRQTFQAYKRAEAVANRVKAERMARVKDIKMPVGSYTIGEYHAAFHSGQGPMGRRMMPNQVDVFAFNRQPTDFTSAESMQKLASALEKAYTPEGRRRRITSERRQAEAMVAVMNDANLNRKLRNLSDDQFDVLWKSTDFARSASHGYEFLSGKSRSDEPWIIERFETEIELAQEYINWSADLKI